MEPATPKIPRLAPQQIEQKLAAMPEWSEMHGAIQRTYQFKDFVAAMKFVNKVAELAEKHRHHPDILVRWNKVTLTLSTHDAEGGGGITHKDFDLAAAADKLWGA